MTPDHELLREYAETGDEAAFAEVVQRYLRLVYSTAFRLLAGDAHLAEDVAQGVFTDLARKARVLSGHETLAGWLHTSTRYLSHKTLRSQWRRQVREQKAVAMHEPNPVQEISLEQLRPVLDEAVGQLGETDRDAVLLRFFQGKSYREVAAILHLDENTVNKRVERALEKMRRHFARQGVTTTGALLATAITVQAATPLPAGLTAKVTGASLAGSTSAGGLAHAVWKIFFMTMKIKTILVAAVAVSAAAFIVSQNREIAQLQARLDERNSTVKKLGPRSAPSASMGQSASVAEASNLDEIQAALAEVIVEMKSGAYSDASKQAFYQFLDQLDNQSMAAALAYADHEGGSERDLLMREILDRWVRTDPAAALAYAQTIEGTRARQIAVRQILEAWAQKDPSTAWAWVQQLPHGSARDEMMSQFLDILAQTNPEVAVQLAGPDASPVTLASLMASWAKKDPHAAIKQTLALPAGDQRTMSLMSLGATLSKSDAQAAFNWANALPNDSDKSAAMTGILPVMEPTQAMGFIATLPNAGQNQFGPALGVMHKWVDADPAAAEEWLKTLPPSFAQQNAVRAYVSVLSPINPAAAAPWAESLTDEQTRTNTIDRVIRDWTRTDPTAATSWLNQTSLSDDAKKQILGHANIGQ